MIFRRLLVCLSLATFASFFVSASADEAPKPNIVFIMADDLGYADTACYGAPDAKTPNIDRLAAEGLKFTNFYAMSCQCTPSRTAILTGRYPQRAGGMECAIGTGNVGRYDEAIALAAKGELGLPADYAVLAPALKSAGYFNGIFGKWHLGYEPKFNPLEQGFDVFTGFLGGNVEYFDHYETSDLEVYVKGREPIKREGYMTDLITEDAVNFLNQRAAEPDTPFFLYLPHSAPHFPFQGPQDREPKRTSDNWMDGTRLSYVAMLESLDAGVGQVMETLEKNGQAKNTIVIFTSDHGAMPPGLNTPYRDYKSTTFDGGLRVPCLVHWPGVIEPGSVSHQVGTLMDLTASFLHIAGVKPPDEKPLDGIDILSHVIDGKPEIPRTLFWRYRRGDETWWGARDGNLKLVRNQKGDAVEEWLFDLSDDPTETNTVAGERPEEYGKIQRELLKWEQEVRPWR
ncbi:MAG: sulfatase-like hydrolase/transferase [Verrucomicrobiae bacterium]|nr:sulfatase-like hydrolase/transferase [Verrucomicrobiae bacterium]